MDGKDFVDFVAFLENSNFTRIQVSLQGDFHFKNMKGYPSKLLTLLKPNYFKKQSSSSFLLTQVNNQYILNVYGQIWSLSDHCVYQSFHPLFCILIKKYVDTVAAHLRAAPSFLKLLYYIEI